MTQDRVADRSDGAGRKGGGVMRLEQRQGVEMGEVGMSGGQSLEGSEGGRSGVGLIGRPQNGDLPFNKGFTDPDTWSNREEGVELHEGDATEELLLVGGVGGDRRADSVHRSSVRLRDNEESEGGDRMDLDNQRNSGGSTSGLKMKRLARAGMVLNNGVDKDNEGVEAGTRSYAEMVKGESDGEERNSDYSSEKGYEMPINTSLAGGTVSCEFEDDHYEGVVNCFRDITILVHFLGRPPNEVDLRRWLQEIWSGKGWYIDRVRYLGKGYYAVVFDENVKVRDVLKEGPWYFKGGLVLVQPWEPEFSVDHGSYGRHPAWVELCNLPVHLWPFARGFFEAIGTVISFDERQTFTFRPHARACVLVDTNKELPKKLEVKKGGKVVYELKILVLGLPNACFRCKQSGHFIRNCPYKISGERKSGSNNQTVPPREANRNGKGKEVAVEMEGVEVEGNASGKRTVETTQEGEKSKIGEMTSHMKEKCKVEGEKEVGGGNGPQGDTTSVIARRMEKGQEKEKENIPTIPSENKSVTSPQKKERYRKGKEKIKGSEEDFSVALIPYNSPPPPTIGDFLMEALATREEEQAQEFQVVRRKSKRFPLTTGTREDPRTTGKVQKLCLEWDAKGSR